MASRAPELAIVHVRMQTPVQYQGLPLLECIGQILRASRYGYDVTDELAWLRQQGELGVAAADVIEDEARER